MDPFSNLLNIPLKLIRIQLRIEKPVQFRHFYHGNVLRSFILNLLTDAEMTPDHNLPPGMVPICIENGYLIYQPGEGYLFGLVLIGQAISYTNLIRERLLRKYRPNKGVLVLGENVVLSQFQELEVDVAEMIHRVRAHLPQKCTIRFLTPLRIPRVKDDVVPGHTMYDARLLQVDVFLKKVLDRIKNLSELSVIEAEFARFPDLKVNSEFRLLQRHLTWLELPTRKRSKNYGGVAGRIVVEGPLSTWLIPLAIGQFLHVGEKINFGFGYYDLPELFPELSTLFRPAQTLLKFVVRSENLWEAFQDTRTNSKMPGVDGTAIEDIEMDYPQREENLRVKVSHGEYAPPPLLGMVISDKQGKPRALAVPTIEDRWLQRAVLNIIGPAIDTVLEDCSYAYRRNYSRQRAREALRQAYQEGYRYVVESDIENFFDEVEWDILIHKLRALYPYDPVVDLLEKWITPAVEFRGKRIERRKGLPQGAVISPLLSNLYLDEFDESMQALGFKLIRFADDFVIVCKSRKEAEKALLATRQALQRLDLEIKEAKTSITHFDQGFHYLGYLFCRSVIIEKSKQEAQEPFQWELLDETKIPPNSWLAQARISGKTVQEYIRQARYRHFKKLVTPASSLQVPTRKPLYIGGYRNLVKVRRHALVMVDRDRGQIVHRYPLESIQHVTLLGAVPISIPALMTLLKRDIPVFLCSSRGHIVGTFQPLKTEWQLWNLQVQKFMDSMFAFRFSQSIVMAKINNYIKSLRFVDFPNKDNVLADLKRLEDGCLNKTTVASLRGSEGRAAALFYQAMASYLDKAWGFPGRRKHPATDPINALLSLGYTILYNHITTAIIGVGLNPQIGIFHQSRGKYFALSSDLQEEFRFLVDRLVLSMIHLKQIKAQDFHHPEKIGNLFLLGKKIKIKFIEYLEKRFNETLSYPPAGHELSYRELFHFQVKQLKEIIEGTRLAYQPFRRR